MSMGLDIEEHDQEGRIITAEYPDFYGVLPAPLLRVTAYCKTLHPPAGCIRMCPAPNTHLRCAIAAVVNSYVPNAGEGLKRLEYRLSGWDVAFSEHLARLSKQKPVILAGDLNCAPQPIDIHNPKR